jgi:hypothetical protein
MRDTLIEFMDSLREYVAESGTNIAHDERDSSEFVDIFLNKGQTLPIDSVVVSKAKLCDCNNTVDPNYDPCCSYSCWSKKFD